MLPGGEPEAGGIAGVLVRAIAKADQPFDGFLRRCRQARERVDVTRVNEVAGGEQGLDAEPPGAALAGDRPAVLGSPAR